MQSLRKWRKQLDGRISHEDLNLIMQKINFGILLCSRFLARRSAHRSTSVAFYLRLKRKIVKRSKHPLVYTSVLDPLKNAVVLDNIRLQHLLLKHRDLYLQMLDFFDEVGRRESKPDLKRRIDGLRRTLRASEHPTIDDLNGWLTELDHLQQEVRFIALNKPPTEPMLMSTCME